MMKKVVCKKCLLIREVSEAKGQAWIILGGEKEGARSITGLCPRCQASERNAKEKGI